jgi:predicted nucleic acid-binding Zn ribbon protein
MAIEPLPSQRRPVELSESLARLGSLIGSARPDTLATVTSQWEQVVGSRLARHCRLRSLHDRTLVVEADEPAVAEQVRWSAGDLVGAVNAMVGRDAVDAVEVRVLPRGDGRTRV